MEKNVFIVKKEKIYLFLELFAFKLILDFLYVNFVNSVYAYHNFIVDFNLTKYIIGFIWFFIICYFLPDKSYKASSIILLLHFIIMVLPIFTIYAFKNESSIFFNMVCICFTLECVLLRYLPSIHISKIKQAKNIFYATIGIITIFVYISMLMANGIPSLKALNLLSVYDIREDVKYPFLMNYLVNWQAKAVNPLMIAISYKYKKNSTLILFFSLQILIYLITAHKAYIFIPIAIIFIMHISKIKRFLNIIACSASLGCIFAYVLYKLEISLVVASYFIRRLMFVPAQLKFYYYDFASKNDFLYFSAGALGKLFGTEYPYDRNFANLIAEVYFDTPNMSANTGYLASGYSNLGFVGMLIYTVILSIILVLIDSLGKSLDKSMVIGIVLFTMLALNDGDLLTTLLTGGLIFLLLLLYLYASFNYEEDTTIHKIKG